LKICLQNSLIEICEAENTLKHFWALKIEEFGGRPASVPLFNAIAFNLSSINITKNRQTLTPP
jgi:hypothetical protein